MERWSLKIKLTERGPWVDIHIVTSNDIDAWIMFGRWRSYNNVTDWYAAMAYQL